MDCSPPGSSVHGILQARILEWAAMPSFRESSQPREQTCPMSLMSTCTGKQILYHHCHVGSPTHSHKYNLHADDPQIFRSYIFAKLQILVFLSYFLNLNYRSPLASHLI